MHNDLSRSPYRPPAHLQLPGMTLCGTAVLPPGCGMQCCRQQLPYRPPVPLQLPGHFCAALPCCCLQLLGPSTLASGGVTCRPCQTLQLAGLLGDGGTVMLLQPVHWAAAGSACWWRPCCLLLHKRVLLTYAKQPNR